MKRSALESTIILEKAFPALKEAAVFSVSVYRERWGS
jgi:hypothetical protein